MQMTATAAAAAFCHVTAAAAGADVECLAFACDITQPDQVAAMVSATKDNFGRLDYAFNNAGISGNPAPVHAMPLEVRCTSTACKSSLLTTAQQNSVRPLFAAGRLSQQCWNSAVGSLYSSRCCTLHPSRQLYIGYGAASGPAGR
jgi:NAD(P)-dependent dehydrogenase (short-subunit alcohol dehydrogenase family)